MKKDRKEELRREKIRKIGRRQKGKGTQEEGIKEKGIRKKKDGRNIDLQNRRKFKTGGREKEEGRSKLKEDRVEQKKWIQMGDKRQKTDRKETKQRRQTEQKQKELPYIAIIIRHLGTRRSIVGTQEWRSGGVWEGASDARCSHQRLRPPVHSWC